MKRMLLMTLLCLHATACGESGVAPDQSRQTAPTPQLRTDLSIDEVQQAIEQMFTEVFRFEEATAFLKTIDVEHLAHNIPDDNQQIAYWGLMEDGLSIPLKSDKQFSIEELIAMEDNVWVFPGTQDAINQGAMEDWMSTTYEVAERFNTALTDRRAEVD